jgi:hypothetical protein
MSAAAKVGRPADLSTREPGSDALTRRGSANWTPGWTGRLAGSRPALYDEGPASDAEHMKNTPPLCLPARVRCSETAVSNHTTQSAAAWQPSLPLTDGRFTQISNALHDMVESPREFQFAALLMSYRWYPTSPIIPSVKTIAGKLKCSQRTVRRLAATFEARGWLKREERRAHDRRQMSNEYVLCGPLLALVTDVEASRDQDTPPSWQGRRTDTAGKEHSGNQTNRTRQQNGRSTPPKPGADYLETRYGRLVPRQ